MEKLFPIYSPYEIIDSSKSAMEIKVIKQLKSDANKLENKLNKLKKEMVKSTNLKNEFKSNFFQLTFGNSKKSIFFIYSSALVLISFVKILLSLKNFYFS